MEFLDDETRPRFLFQSRPQSSAPTSDQHSADRLSKPFLFITTAISVVLMALSILYIQFEPFKSILFWAALSLLVGPFAPASVTGGDIRVGRGPVVQFPDPEPEPEQDIKKKSSQKRSKPVASDSYAFNSAPRNGIADGSARSEEKTVVQARGAAGNAAMEEEKDWSEEDLDILRKQLTKHPAGKPKRWEIIAAAFNGRHRVESVIKQAKELADRKSSDKDSYAQFLKNRKPLDKRADGNSNGEVVENNVDEVKQESDWSSGEDIALLNALKAFPKDAPMRWEKIAATVPGKTKAACMKRVSELKRDFRSAKAAKD